MTEVLPSTSRPLASAEGIRCPAPVDGVHHHAHQSFPLPEASCGLGLAESDPRMYDFVVDPTRTDFWGGLHSQQAWTSTPPTQFVQNPSSPSIRAGSDRGSSSVDAHGNNLASCSRISEPLNVASTIPDATGGPAFTMTCPIPHCYFQCQAVLGMWRHVTWTHVRPNSKESGIESIVERVVLGGLS